MINQIIKRVCDIIRRAKSGYLMVATLGTFLGISSIAYLGYRYEAALLFPSLASSAIVLFASPVSMTKVKCIVGGQLLSALAGVTVYQLLGSNWWSVSISVALAMVLMDITNTLHPPGGATAFVAVISKQNYAFVLKPVSLGLGILILSALVVQFLALLKDTKQSDKIKSSNHP
ncbi:HPP family protein [Thermincola potens]|uniref:HPP family protein n=1 Tax=Thermincola potens (strain JR) TaxID=635013 RepID=D5X937_THEPJ|nr:HPP family protein [Thermincola potens]ADG81037.1 HPP family protein [Thermincola potens JR]